MQVVHFNILMYCHAAIYFFSILNNFEGVQVVQRGAPTDCGGLCGAGGQPPGVPPVHHQRPRDPSHEVSERPVVLCLLTQL